MTPGLWLYAVLFAGAVAAGWVDSIAGGGGLVTVPLLLWVGLPPHMALGTNKFQSSFGSCTAAFYYARKGVVPLRDALPGVLFTLLGAVLGTLAVQRISSGVLNAVIPVLLLAIAVFMLATPKLGRRAETPAYARLPFFAVSGLVLGFYDGFFGPGVGSFWAIAFVLGRGFDLKTATGYTKVMNVTSNAVSFVLFLAGGYVLLAAGLVMAVGEIIGARIGSGMVVSRGVRFIRPVFVVMVILTTLKLLYDRLS